MPDEKKDLLELVKQGRTLVSDGAMGTLLIERGLKSGQCPESMNLEQPAVLEDIARLYMEAGADIVHTNTFGASLLKLSTHELEDKIEEINRSAIQAVKKGVGGNAFVSLSCGPSGKLLKPFGDTEPEALADSFARQMEAVAAVGVDAICVETMTDLTEAVLAVKAAKAATPSTPVMATMTFDATPRGFFTIMGITIEKAATELAEAGAEIVGSNCGNGIEKMVEIAGKFRECTKLPIIIQSNAGLPELRDYKAVYTESPEFMAEKSKALRDMGVAVIGGCCGTTPGHIQAFRRMVDDR